MVSELQSWKELARLAAQLIKSPLREIVDTDNRFSEFALAGPGLLVDLSKQRLDTRSLAALHELATARRLPSAIADLFAGAEVNPTEQRPALHTLLRAPNDGSPRAADIHATLERLAQLTAQLRSGARRGATNKPINHVVHIGIGGSHLGPELATLALRPANCPLDVHFVANIDPAELDEVLAPLDPERTLFVVVSKTFTTLETLENARAARAWLLQRSMDTSAVDAHFIGVTSNVEAAAAFGIAADNVFPMWDWVGGRYSLWSAVGLPVMLTLGAPGFAEFLAGAHAMDQHFVSAEPHRNLPLNLALVGIWNTNFLGISNHAVLPYSRRLALLPDYLQQLEMESNGKSVDVAGQRLDIHSAPIVWGGVGTNGQHAYHQLLHQGTRSFTADFVVVRSTLEPTPRGRWLWANALAQSQAMLAGSDEADPHRAVAGNHPSTTIVLDELTPYTLGSLLALYEHKVFCQGAIWNINPFDQFGVELGKRLSAPIYTQLEGAPGALTQDASTQGLISHLRKGATDV